MSDNSCSNNDGVDRLANFAKAIIKSFILLTIVLSTYYLKKKYIPNDGTPPTVISIILFILLGTVLMTVLGVTDMYIFNNVVLGLGIGLGMKFFD